jgi:diketogulonate reductase-like aldo/keto reductase
VNQCEYHPFLAKRFQPVLDYCAAHKIVFESYMMFGGSNPESKAKLLTHPIVKEVAAALKHSKTGNPVLPSQVLLKFSTQQGLVVLPKSLDEKHMAENLELYDFELSQEQLTKLKALSDEVPGGALHFAWNPTNME